MPAGRPKEHDREEIRKEFLDYIENTEIPIVAEFAVFADVNRQRLYEWEELADALKRCIAKKESALERLALSGKVNTAMAIFSLKQLGWSDRQDMTLKGDAAHPLQISSTDANL
jgi:hypothetical protein